MAVDRPTTATTETDSQATKRSPFPGLAAECSPLLNSSSTCSMARQQQQNDEKTKLFEILFFLNLYLFSNSHLPFSFLSLSLSCYYHDCFLNCSTKWIFKRMFFNSHVLILKWKFVCYGAPNTPCPLCWFDLFFISSLSFSLIGCLHLSEPSLLCSSDMLSTE